MPSYYSITEPHPTANQFVRSGRGGAGNTFRAPETSKGINAHGPASLFGAGLPASSSKFSSGRGGAGNIHQVSERPVFSFDEELERQNTRERKAAAGEAYHVGRGGAGNFSSSRLQSSRKDSTSSADSNASSRSGFFGRLSNTFERR